MNDPRDMMAAYAEGQLGADEVAELEAYLRADPERAKAWVRDAMVGCHLDELLREQNLEHMADERSLGEPELPPIHLASSDRLTKQQYLGALSYVLRHTFTPKRLITAGVAAALLLGAALAINLMTGPDTPDLANTPSNMPTASAEQTPRGSDPQPTPIVATLTAERDAQWAEDALAPGSPLQANQRLTLTAGFAEITTSRGAVAILEAPATIELLDNNNALRLHSGKLVGICETDSSKGFLVRTPHIDVTDLGTEFGVELAGNRVTTTVFTGKVELASPGDEPQVLTANQTAWLTVDGLNRELTLDNQIAKGFEALLKNRQPAIIRQLLQDPAMIGYYDPSRSTISGDRITNLSSGSASDLVLEGASLRADEPGAAAVLDLPGKPHACRLTADRKVSAITLAAWVRIDSLPEDDALLEKNKHAAILNSDGWSRPGAVHWQLSRADNGAGFGMHFGLRGTGTKQTINSTDAFLSSPQTGQWLHLAVSVDRTQSTAAFYVNGALIDSQRFEGTSEFQIGSAQVGSWTPEAGYAPRPFNGQIDELAIIGRALSAQEIRHLYEANPQSASP